MNLVSYNLRNYINLDSIKDVVIRVNSAWHGKNRLHEDLAKVSDYPIFFDFDRGRQKPPVSGFRVEDLEQILIDFPNIKYVAVSNIEEIIDLKPFIHLNTTLVPKIETARGIKMFVRSYDPLYLDIPYVMLDHGDLFNDLAKNNLSTHLYDCWINPFVESCKEKGIRVLRERGLLFSEK